MRTEHAKKKLADLDAALLNLKHSITSNVKNLSVPNTDMLTEISLNVLRRAQLIRDSLVETVWQKKRKPRKASAKTARAAVKTKKPVVKRKPTAAKKKTTRKK